MKPIWIFLAWKQIWEQINLRRKITWGQYFTYTHYETFTVSTWYSEHKIVKHKGVAPLECLKFMDEPNNSSQSLPVAVTFNYEFNALPVTSDPEKNESMKLYSRQEKIEVSSQWSEWCALLRFFVGIDILASPILLSNLHQITADNKWRWEEKDTVLINRIELVEESKASQGDNMIKDHWHRAEDIFRLLLEVSVLIQLEANTTELGRMKTARAHSRLVFFFALDWRPIWLWRYSVDSTAVALWQAGRGLSGWV